MTDDTTGNFRGIFGNRSFRRFWLTFTLSAVGDNLTRVALTWFVYEQTGSAAALGLLTFLYTAPVILGGLFAGVLLDRFDRRRVMAIDNLLRAAAMGAIPLLHLLGLLQLWHLYVAAAVYGSLMMVSLAGGPSLVPLIVGKEQLSAANALETLSYTLSSVIGPPLAGVLIAWIGGPAVVALDAVSYLIFAAALISLTIMPETAAQGEAPVSYRLKDAVDLLVRNRVLLSTTTMFVLANVGLGLLLVWLPIHTHDTLGGGSELYGLLLGAMAVGEVASSLIVGNVRLPVALGAAIAGAQALAGLSLGLALVGGSVGWLAASLALAGFFSAPLTIWAQTLRMQVIPDRLRGRTFALLRTLMQSSSPLGGAAAGVLLPVVGIPALMALSAALVGLPGLAGALSGELRQAGAPGRAVEEGAAAD